jgi:hypothetical protein
MRSDVKAETGQIWLPNEAGPGVKTTRIVDRYAPADGGKAIFFVRVGFGDEALPGAPESWMTLNRLRTRYHPKSDE